MVGSAMGLLPSVVLKRESVSWFPITDDFYNIIRKTKLV